MFSSRSNFWRWDWWTTSSTYMSSQFALTLCFYRRPAYFLWTFDACAVGTTAPGIWAEALPFSSPFLGCCQDMLLLDLNSINPVPSCLVCLIDCFQLDSSKLSGLAVAPREADLNVPPIASNCLFLAVCSQRLQNDPQSDLKEAFLAGFVAVFVFVIDFYFLLDSLQTSISLKSTSYFDLLNRYRLLWANQNSIQRRCVAKCDADLDFSAPVSSHSRVLSYLYYCFHFSQ